MTTQKHPSSARYLSTEIASYSFERIREIQDIREKLIAGKRNKLSQKEMKSLCDMIHDDSLIDIDDFPYQVRKVIKKRRAEEQEDLFKNNKFLNSYDDEIVTWVACVLRTEEGKEDILSLDKSLHRFLSERGFIEEGQEKADALDRMS